MQAGDRVKVLTGQYQGQTGMVASITGGVVRVSGIHPKGKLFFRPDDLRAVEQEQDSGPPYDFDRTGLGIGGLGRYDEPATIPTLEQMERLGRMEQRARYCRRCGESDVFDGAMFTTDPASCLCDDCYG